MSKTRFWQKPSFWQKVEKWKPYVKVGISALKVAKMLLSPDPVSYAIMAQEIIKTTIAAGNPPAEPTEIIEFLADLAIHRLAQEEEVGTAIELFLETPVYISDWRPDKPKCSLAVGGALCEGIFVPSSLLRASFPDFAARDEAIWKYIREEQARLDEIDRLAEEKELFEEADRLYKEEQERLDEVTAVAEAGRLCNENGKRPVDNTRESTEDTKLQCCYMTAREPEPLISCSGEDPLFSIGGGTEKLTHVSFEGTNILYASIHVTVDKTASIGLNFYALQVNFDNQTWAHGGLQDLDGGDSGNRKKMINWGGLVDRGGGSADYSGVSDESDLQKIQVVTHSGEYAWKKGVQYEYTVERGPQITLPPGDYRLFPDKPLVKITNERRMWQWFFTVKPVCDTGPSFSALIYNTSGTITWWSVWNESGYGSTNDDQLTRWWSPLYRLVADGVKGPLLKPKSWKRF